MAISKERTELVRTIIRRYPNWGKQTIAKHILQNYGHLFNNNLEAIRSSIRYHCGQMGEKNRAKVGDKLIERTEKIVLPQSWNVPVEPYIMTPGKWFILNDVHIPFHEERPLQTAIDFAKKEKPDGIYLNGDIWEGQSVSFWPSVKRDFLGEVAAVIDFLDYLKQEFPKTKIVYLPGNHECFSHDTEVLTNNGWITYDNLNEQCKIATLNVESNTIEYQYPLAIHKYNHVGNMVNIKSRQNDLLITENHRLIYKYPQTKKWKINEFKNIPINDGRVILPCSGNSYIENSEFTDDELLISGWLLTDCHIRRKNNSQASYTLYQRESNYTAITSILDRLGWDYSIQSRETTVTEICGRKLKSIPKRAFIITLLKDSHKKANRLVESRERLPQWAFNLSNRQFKILLSSIVDGDGSRHKSAPETSWMVYKQKLFLDDLLAASIQYGYRASISEYRPKQYRLNITPGNVITLDRFKNHVTHEEYSGIVWCVTTPNDTVIVRRNGKVSITGNSRLPRYFINKASEMATSPAIELETYMSFEARGIEFLEHGTLVKFGYMDAIHGHEVQSICSSVAPARGLFLRTKTCAFCGHVHRTNMYPARDLNGKMIICYTVGCMSNLHPEFHRYGNDWNHGFGMLDLKKDNNFSFRNYRIMNDGKDIEL